MTLVFFKTFFCTTNAHRRGSTPVFTVLRKSVRFFIKRKLSELQGFIRGEGTGQGSYLNDSETQERRLWEVKSEKVSMGACPRTPLESCAFGALLGNRSVFMLDPTYGPQLQFSPENCG